MTVDEALVIVEASLKQRRLNRIEELLFRQVWEGQSYAEIAANCGYDAAYLKNIGSKLWQSLSTALGEKVTKNNVQSVLKRRTLRAPMVVTIPVSLYGLQVKQPFSTLEN